MCGHVGLLSWTHRANGRTRLDREPYGSLVVHNLVIYFRMMKSIIRRESDGKLNRHLLCCRCVGCVLFICNCSLHSRLKRNWTVRCLWFVCRSFLFVCVLCCPIADANTQKKTLTRSCFSIHNAIKITRWRGFYTI